jgi:hypothetical protein
MAIERLQVGIGWLRGAIWLVATVSMVGAGSVQADPGKSQGAARSAGKGNADWAHQRSADGVKAGTEVKDKATTTADESVEGAGDARDDAAHKATKAKSEREKQQKMIKNNSNTKHEKPVVVVAI